MSTWIAILGVAAATFALRTSFIVFLDPHRFPQWFRRALAYVPPTVLAAIVTPGLLMPAGTLDPANPRCLAGLVAIAVGVRTRSALATIASGMAALWLLQWTMG